MSANEPTEPAHEPSTEHVAARTAETRGQRLTRHLHRARLYTGALAFVALIAVLIVLISANTRTVKLSWAFGSTRASLVWIILATAVVGWLLGIVTAVAFRARTRRPR
jgi:uncharacterized integral membrane protein